jgi:hypothetical protein
VFRRSLLAAVGVGVLAFALIVPIGVAASTEPVSGMEDVNGVACVSTTVCLGVGDTSAGIGATVAITRGVTGRVQEVPEASELLGVACWSATACVAVGIGSSGSEGVVVQVKDGLPGSSTPVATARALNGVACAPRSSASTTCIAVGYYLSDDAAVVRLTAGIPGAASHISHFGLRGVACSSSTSCLGVGEGGSGSDARFIVPIKDGVPGKALGVPRAGSLSGIACISSTTCDAVGVDSSGLRGFVVIVTNGAPGAGATVASAGWFFDVGCSGARCVAVGVNSESTKGAYSILDAGVPGAPKFVPKALFLNGAACETAMTCVVGGDTTNALHGLIITTRA